MQAYYNEIDPYCTAWLQNLIDAGEISPGTVDNRSILNVAPNDLVSYDRCHFFSGIAGWDYALRLAGWPEEWPVWTGSCPCQPFSAAGKGKRGTDERHLWPYWFHLIRVCRPPVIFGEQVASKAGLAWLDLVLSDLEAEGYACGATDLCAAGIGAPHIRQRLWFVALDESYGRSNGEDTRTISETPECGFGLGGTSPTGLLGHAPLQGECRGGLQGFGEGDSKVFEQGKKQRPERPSASGELADLGAEGLSVCQLKELPGERRRCQGGAVEQPSCSTWTNLHWFPCRDGKLRPTGVVADSDERTRYRGLSQPIIGAVSPGNAERNGTRPTQSIIQPLAHGVQCRVGRLRAYGNAIVPQVAATFIQTVMEI